MPEFTAENASLRQLSHHYASGLISLAEYRVARHAILHALESGTEAPPLPQLEQVVASAPDLGTLKHAPFAESGEWHVGDLTSMTPALAADAGAAAPAYSTTQPAGQVAETPAPARMDANSWALLVIILVVTVLVAFATVVYVFRL